MLCLVVFPYGEDMCKKLMMLVLLLAPTLVVQAAPNKAITQKQVDDLTSTVLKYTSSPKLSSSIALIFAVQGTLLLFVVNQCNG